MMAGSDSFPRTESADVRERLVEALQLDLVGPWSGHRLAEERLGGWIRPSTWYLTGFLIPSGTLPDKAADADEDDDLDAIPQAAGLSEESSEDRKAAKKGYFPSSLGLSFLVPQEAHEITVFARWADYALAEIQDSEGKPLSVWQRLPREVSIVVRLAGVSKAEPIVVPGSDGLQLYVAERTIAAADLEERIPSGTRAVSVFLVNRRKPLEAPVDRAYAFQAQLEVHSDAPFVPRPDLRGMQATEWDDQIADLQYADTPEFATGHGVSAEWALVDGLCHRLWSAWIPTAEVEKTESVDRPGVQLGMANLGSLADGAAARAALDPIVDQYRAWITSQQATVTGLNGPRRDTAVELVRRAGLAADRIDEGIALLARDADALDAFRVANRAVAGALTQRLGIAAPIWRAFQIAFVLLNLPGLADPQDRNRETVDLLFFPTGGGKTEAYLGLAAFAMVMRRLRHPGDSGLAGAGVSVLMRYTLRLLTLDQLSRAAGLVCSLELERELNVARLGRWPFEIGLWVGKAATPNVLGKKGDNRPDSARTKVRQFKADSKSRPSPIPLENCPWCTTRFGSNSFQLLPNDDAPSQLRVVCTNFECAFSGNRSLPVVAVDEQLYRRLPAFLIATVDKFAALPWTGEAGALLGGAQRFNANGFYSAAEPGKGNRLTAPLPPPDLIIQDELHLISGPLGTMAGLYETAIEALCIGASAGHAVRPKIVASTATVRLAQDQIQALFARSSTQVFPPPGPNRRNSFFARSVPSTDVSARLYLGVAAQGRNPKTIMRRAWLALMGAAQRAYLDAGGYANLQNPADPYMTVLGYFNSLRELGGARRLLEEEVQNTIKGYGSRRRIGEEFSLFQDRNYFSEVLELTSRVSTDKVAEARRRLAVAFNNFTERVDCAIATNMVSVGLDITRLGLMVVFGQPKTHAEYIQATSRVGRDDQRPGLIVTLLNIHKPRDRSHYERFRHYHETFYRSVEVSSVTPFSARALDRGFPGALVGLARQSEPTLTTPRGVEKLRDVRVALEGRLVGIFLARVQQQPFTDDAERQERLRSVQSRIVDLLDSWQKIVDEYAAASVAVQYQPYELKGGRPLLRNMLDTDFESELHRKFRANRSLRDVEPEVNLYLRDLNGQEVGDPA